MSAESTANHSLDPVSDILKWILLAVAVTTFAVLAWTTGVTYQEAPPFPDRFIAADGTPLMSAADIQAGGRCFPASSNGCFPEDSCRRSDRKIESPYRKAVT